MDHNLDDSLNLEGDIGVDFEHSEDTVVNQPDIGLDSSSHDEGIPMEFEHIEEQPMLMDTGNEEIIVSDFMADDFQLQEYCTQEMAIASTSAESHDQTVYTSEPESTVSLQYEPQSISVQASGLMLQDILTTPKIINVQAGIGQAGRPTIKKEVIVTKSTAPRQVAIAPKPPKLSQFNPRAQKPSFVPGKQFAIAPKPVGKPVTLVANKSLGFMKKVSLAGAMTTTTKGNSVLAQLGKQLVMVPARAVPPGAQKIKLVSGPGGSRILTAADSKQTQLVSGQTIAVSQASKTLGTKIILQGQPSVSGGNSPAVITKLLPGAPAGSHALKCVTMHQKTVPVSISNNKVVMATPTKQGVRYAGKKQQIIAIRSPTTKLVSATTHNTIQGTANKKIIITSSPSQNVILKTTAPQKAGQVPKIGSVGQRSQLHQINVPGKGIQYIRLITNATQTPAKQSPKASASAPSSKTVILTDSKGKVIQMTSDKMTGGHPPPLVTTNINSVVQSKPQQKLVRIAPVTSRSGQAAMQQARTGQSLLAPVSPSQALSAVTMEHVATLLAQSAVVARETEPDQASETDEAEDSDEDENMDQPRIKEEVDSKDALRALIADTIGDGSDVNEVEVDYDRTQSPEHEDSSGSEAPEEPSPQPHEQAHAQTPTQAGERPVIVVPSYYEEDLIVPDDTEQHPREPRKQANMQLEVETLGEYQAPPSPGGISETDVIANELGLLRPRKACNCTKSQCLKLYCDCFANGEFCNRCNCVNCHNNLENEELRQKAIRGCLDRNPNAFRPKIGKSKTGGPEIIRRHNKGCNCKRSGCLKNYCECYEAKIACTAICKCVGCRNVEETLERGRRRHHAKPRDAPRDTRLRPPLIGPPKQPCSFMTCEVIEAVCQCLLAAAVESDDAGADAGPDVGLGEGEGADPVRDVIDEFARCLQDIISASHQPEPVDLFNDVRMQQA